jgi:hypothetical protein
MEPELSGNGSPIEPRNAPKFWRRVPPIKGNPTTISGYLCGFGAKYIECIWR